MERKLFWLVLGAGLVLALLAISGCDVMGGRPEPTATPTKTAWVMVVTATFTPSPTPPPPTATSEPTATPEPSPTPEPTATIRPTRRPQPTRKPTQPPPPPPTAAPTWQYRGSVDKWDPNCGTIGILGHVYNMDGSGRQFVVIKVCSEGGEWCTRGRREGFEHPFTGKRPEDPGWYDCLLGDDKLAIETKANPRWYYAVVVDSQEKDDSELSERLRIGPFTCETNGWAHVNWQRLIP